MAQKCDRNESPLDPSTELPDCQGSNSGMDHNELIDHLAQAERHVKLGEEHIARQTELIARMELQGLDTGEAKRLLGVFKEMLAVHIAGRNRLREMLVTAAETTSGSPAG